MHVLMIFGLVVLTTVSGRSVVDVSGDETDLCETSKVGECSNALFKQVEYTGDGGNFEDFEKFMGEKYYNDNFGQLCKAISDAGKCFEGCLTVENLIKIGSDSDNAYSYVFWANQHKYACGPGIKGGKYILGCVAKAAVKNQKAFGVCENNFEESLAKEPANFCLFTDQHLKCTSEQFSECGSEAKDVMCQSFKAGFNSIFPSSCPNLSCKPAKTCDLLAVTKCSDGLFKQLNYTGETSIFKDFEKFLKKNYFNENFDQLCTAISDAHKCFAGCLTVENLAKMGLDSESAHAYVFLAYQIKYECGPGRNDIEKYGECIGKAGEENEKTFEDCEKNFRENIEKEPENLCLLTKQYHQCLSEPFNECGQKAKSVMCESIRAGFNAIIPCTDLQCQ